MSVCDVPLVDELCSDLGDAAGSVWTAPLEALATATGGVAEFLIRAMWEAFDSTTMVDVTTGEFVGVYNLVFGVALFWMVAFFLLQLITAMLRREPAALARAALGLGKSLLGSFLVVTLTALLLEVTDQVCRGIVAASGTTMEEIGLELAGLAAITVTAGTASTVGALLNLFLAGMTAAAVFVVWVSLLVRKALLLLAVVLAPFALAGASWDATRGWVTKWATFVVALILSKLVLVVVFLLATAQLSTPLAADVGDLSDKLTGIVLLLVAAFAPYMTYKAISFMGFDMYHAMSIEQEAKGALNRPVPTVTGASAAGGYLGNKAPKVLGPDGSPASGARGGTGARTTTGSTPGAANGGSTTATMAQHSTTAGTGAEGATAGGGSAARAGAVGGGTAGVGALSAAAAPVAAGAVIAKKTADSGGRAGAAVAGTAGQHAAAADDRPDGAGPAPRPAKPRPLTPSPRPQQIPGLFDDGGKKR